ncbi:MAG: hypothetical protein GY716_01550 [bacterium]|nr:hypothetical protein [bacterium]
MALLEEIDLQTITPASLWPRLEPDTRKLAAEAVYRGNQGGTVRREADVAIATALRFREVAVRKLPTDRRIEYLIGRVHADDGLASSLLLALHLEHRIALLETFLDDLEIPQENGAIDDEFDLQPAEPERLRSAVAALREKFPTDQVDVYLASLIALDPETWGGLTQIL